MFLTNEQCYKIVKSSKKLILYDLFPLNPPVTHSQQNEGRLIEEVGEEKVVSFSTELADHHMVMI